MPKSLHIICSFYNGWMYYKSASSTVQFFKNCLISFIFYVTCIILKYLTFSSASTGPHFKSSRKSIIFEWKDNANNTFFFSSSLISWMTKQCFEISIVNYNCFISYSCSARTICLNLLRGKSSLGSSYYVFASVLVSSFFISRKASPQAMLMKELLLIYPPYFLASFNST